VTRIKTEERNASCEGFFKEDLEENNSLIDRYAEEMHALVAKLFPINRSLTGNGVRETLNIIKEILPELEIHEVKSGTQVFDWTIPNEWNLHEAYIIDPDGNKICDSNVCNLHVLNYALAIDTEMDLDALKPHIHTIEGKPDAIPYVTSYYNPHWGFCMTHNQFKELKPGKYKVYINATLAPGSLTYAELKIPGEEEKELFFSTYVCHPSMANNELSGPVLATFLAKWIKDQPRRRYSYRFVFVPETIGSITYISKNLKELQDKVYAGFNITCVGDERAYSYLPSRDGDGASDHVIQHVLKHTDVNYKTYSFLHRGSDERQYCSPGVNLKVASLMRSKYGTFPEYHTSLDDLTLVTAKGLGDSLLAYMRCVATLEKDYYYLANQCCEPQMGKRGLYPTIGNQVRSVDTRRMMDMMAYCDGTNSVLDIANIIKSPAWSLLPLFDMLKEHQLISVVNPN